MPYDPSDLRTALATKPARMVDAGEAVQLVGPPPRFVGRGGEKLDGALDRFGIDVAGRRCLDDRGSRHAFRLRVREEDQVWRRVASARSFQLVRSAGA